MYYTRYRDEVQARIDANAAMTPEAIERRYPGLMRFTGEGLTNSFDSTA